MDTLLTLTPPAPTRPVELLVRSPPILGLVIQVFLVLWVHNAFRRMASPRCFTKLSLTWNLIDMLVHCSTRLFCLSSCQATHEDRCQCWNELSQICHKIATKVEILPLCNYLLTRARIFRASEIIIVHFGRLLPCGCFNGIWKCIELSWIKTRQ